MSFRFGIAISAHPIRTNLAAAMPSALTFTVLPSSTAFALTKVVPAADSSNLVGADLTYAKLTNADLTGANISDAQLNNTHLGGAALTGGNRVVATGDTVVVTYSFTAADDGA